MQRVIFPRYTSHRHETLVTLFKADLNTLAGKHFYAGLLHAYPDEREARIDATVRNKFEMPVYAFNKVIETAYFGEQNMSDLSDGALAAYAVSRIVGKAELPKQVAICRALVTCGMRTGPSCFPESYQERVHQIGAYEDRIAENLEFLCSSANISRHEVNATRATHLLVTESEADLASYWKGIKPNVIERAPAWSAARHLCHDEKEQRWKRKLLLGQPKHELR